MKTIIQIIITIALFPLAAKASTRTCVDTIHGQLCANYVSIQDSQMNHHAYEIRDFELANRRYTMSKDFSAKFICSAFAPNSTHTRPQLPFGYSKITKKVVTRWTTYSNGDCRPFYADALIAVECYSD
jgi:hypothetical protein